MIAGALCLLWLALTPFFIWEKLAELKAPLTLTMEAGIGRVVADHCAREMRLANEIEASHWDDGKGAFWFDPARWQMKWDKWPTYAPLQRATDLISVGG